MAIENIYELFILDSETFVVEAYRCLLGRDPDEHGLAYYLGRLAVGYSKEEVVTQLALSTECKQFDKVQGLKSLVNQVRKSNHWLWGRFGRASRLERTIRSIGMEQAAHRQNVIGLIPICTSLQEIILKLSEYVREMSVKLSHEGSADHRLSREDVCNAFLDVLGREPENEEVVAHHARLPTLEALRIALMESREYRSKAPGEYASKLLDQIVRNYKWQPTN